MRRFRIELRALAGSRRLLLAFLVAAVGCASRRVGVASAAPNTAVLASALVGSWALLDADFDSARRSPGSPHDTAVWHIEADGRLRHTQVRVLKRGERNVASERSLSRAIWWVESRSLGGAAVPVLCTTPRPGRGYQCGRVTVDTATSAEGRSLQRLTWSGVTYVSQRWSFLARKDST